LIFSLFELATECHVEGNSANIQRRNILTWRKADFDQRKLASILSAFAGSRARRVITHFKVRFAPSSKANGAHIAWCHSALYAQMQIANSVILRVSLLLTVRAIGAPRNPLTPRTE
jgi:hypothetical protein